MVVLVTAALQLTVEYLQAKNDIINELAGLEKIFAEPLTEAIWAETIPQVEAMAKSITKLTFVSGIVIINEDSGLKLTKFLTRESDLFYRFKLFYTFEKQSIYQATRAFWIG